MTPIGITLNLSGERQVEQGLQRVRGAMDNVGTAAGGLARMMGGLGGAFAGVLSVREFIQAADAVTSLQNQLKLATGSASQAAQAYDALFDIAQRSRVSFTELGGTFASIARATGELGISQQRLLTVTEAIGNAVTISGTGAQAANAALVQLGQGLASGTLRGEELNSVMEQTPRLAQALADGLGITTGELRKLGSEGAITAEKVIKALESQAGALRNEVKDAVLTVGQAMTLLQSQTVRFVGDVDKATSASGTLAQSITGVASALGELQQTEVFMDSLRTVGETVTVLFNDVAFVLKGIGREIGGIAAQAAAVARLDFKGAAAIRNEMVADAVSARATLDARQLAILTRGSGRATAEDGANAAARGVGRRSAFDAELSRYLGEDVRQTRDEIRAEEVAKARQRNAELVAKAEGDVNAQIKLQAALKVELANIEEKYRGKGSAAGVKAEQSAYESLMTTINEKIGTVQAELSQNDKLTASQKIAIDMEAGLLSGKLKLSAARKAELEGRLEDLRTLEEESAARQRLAQSFDAMEAAQAKALADRDTLRGEVYDAEQEAKQIGLVGAALGELTKARMEDAAAELERRAKTHQAMRDDTTAQALREQAQAMRDLYRVQGNNEAARGVAAYAGAIRESSEALDYELSLMGMAERARATALEQYRIEIELRKQIQQIEANTAADPERRAQLVAEATAAAAIAKANASSKVFLEEWKQSVQQYDDIFRQGFADMLNNGKDGWKSFTRSLVTTFKTTVADAIYKMFAQPFVVQLVGSIVGMTGGGAGNAAMQMASGGSSGIMGLVGNAGGSLLSSLTGGSITGIGSAASLWGGLNGTILPAGMMGPSVAAPTLMSGAGNMLAAIPGWGWALAGVGALLGSVLGRKVEKRGYGLMGTLGEEDGIHDLDLMRKGGSLFGGPKWFVRDTGVSDMDKALQETYKQQRDALIDMGKALGLATDGVENFTVQLGSDELGDKKVRGIRLDGLSDEEAQKKIAEALATANNEIAQQIIGTWERTVREVERIDISRPTDVGDTTDYGVPNVIRESIVDERYIPSEFARDGEQAIDTLTRLATSLTGVNTAFENLGVTLYEASLAGGDMASQLVDLFGGLEQFSQSTGVYMQNFYSAEEQRDVVRRQLERAFDGLDLKLPDIDASDARAQFRAIAEAQDLTAESGRRTWAALMGLAGAFSSVTQSSEDAARAAEQAAEQAASAAQQAAEQAAEQAARILEKEQDLQIQLLRAQGNELAAVAIERQRELEALKQFGPAAQGIQRDIWAIIDAAAALQAGADAYFAEVDRKAAEQGYVNDAQAAIDKMFGSVSEGAAAAAQAAASAAQAAAATWRNAASSIQSSLDKLRADTTADMDPAARLALTRAQLAAYTQAALGGDADAASKMASAADAFLQASDVGSITRVDYMRDRIMAEAQLASVLESSEAKASVQESIAAAANASVSELQALNSNLTGFAGALYELLGKGYQGVDRGTAESVAQSFAKMQADYDAYFANTTGFGAIGNKYTDASFNGASFTKLNNNMAAFTGADGIVSYIRAGESLVEVAKRIPELRALWEKSYGIKLPAFAVGTNYVPFDTPAIVHKGERIIPAADNRALMSALQNGAGGANAELVNEIRALRAEVASLRAAAAETADNTRNLPQMVDQFDNVTEGGNAIRNNQMNVVTV